MKLHMAVATMMALCLCPFCCYPTLTNARQMNIIVTGGSNNNYYSIGGLSYRQSVQIDAWR